MAGSSLKKKDKKEHIFPGPGFYDVETNIIESSMDKGKGAKLLGRFPYPKETYHETPGPGQYEVRT